jgi:hypothetical protein
LAKYIVATESYAAIWNSNAARDLDTDISYGSSAPNAEAIPKRGVTNNVNAYVANGDWPVQQGSSSFYRNTKPNLHATASNSQALANLGFTRENLQATIRVDVAWRHGDSTAGNSEPSSNPTSSVLNSNASGCNR